MVFPNPDQGRPVIISGRFGSGKTEISLNYAVWLATQTGYARPMLVDLDIVTPYFRSRELIAEMEARGVEVVAPLALTRSVDVPGITPQILGAIEQTERPVILDVGGDRQGARALSRYRAALQHRGYDMLFVANPYRPYMATPEAVAASVAEIEVSSRLAVSSLVSNPNLMNQTEPDVIRTGHSVVEAAARLMALPISFIVVPGGLAASLDGVADLGLPVLPLTRYFVLPWEGA